MPPQIEEVRAEMEKLKQGAPIPSLEISVARQMWGVIATPGITIVPTKTNTGNAVGTSSLNSRQFVTQLERGRILISLIGRGVLRDYLRDEESIEKVLVTAATFPCNEDDVAEATFLFHLTQAPPEVVRKEKPAMEAGGFRVEWNGKTLSFDPDNPKIDGKFIQWMIDNC